MTDSSREKRYAYRRALGAMPAPRNLSELHDGTEWFFGIPLDVTLWVHGTSGRYEVRQDYNSYHGDGWAFSTYCVDGYDRSRDFWHKVFGSLTCGGIAKHSYGQFNIEGHRELRRLESLRDSVAGKTGAGRVRPAFTRLVPILGGEENTAILGSGCVLRDGREDGASTASPEVIGEGSPLEVLQ